MTYAPMSREIAVMAHRGASRAERENTLEAFATAGRMGADAVELDVRRTADGPGFAVTITPVHVFPILSPDTPGEIVTWERREYDDVLSFDTDGKPPAPAADVPPSAEPVP